MRDVVEIVCRIEVQKALVCHDFFIGIASFLLHCWLHILMKLFLMTGWQAAQCQLLVDPLSRGHSAVVNYYTTPHLKYNGQRMELLYENKCDRDFNHYMDVSLLRPQACSLPVKW